MEVAGVRPKVGIALGAGAARGLAHIGVLQVFREHDIPVDVVAGTSAGAIVGSLFAAGTDLDMLARFVQELNWGKLVNVTLPHLGLVSSEPMYQLLRLFTRDRTFADLDVPLAVVATDIRTGEEVVINSGLVADGVRASFSIPGIFVPVERDGRLLVDGGLVNRVPADVCRRLGADVVIAVDVGLPPIGKRVKNLADVILRTIEILDRESARQRIAAANVVIKPELGNVMSTQLNRAAEIIAAGRTAAEKQLSQITAAIRGAEEQAN